MANIGQKLAQINQNSTNSANTYQQWPKFDQHLALSDKQWSTFGRCWSIVDTVLPKLFQVLLKNDIFGQNLSRVWQVQQELDQIGQNWKMSANTWPTSTKLRQSSVAVGLGCWSNFGHCWSSVGRVRPMLVGLGQFPANVGQVCSPTHQMSVVILVYWFNFRTQPTCAPINMDPHGNPTGRSTLNFVSSVHRDATSTFFQGDTRGHTHTCA